MSSQPRLLRRGSDSTPPRSGTRFYIEVVEPAPVKGASKSSRADYHVDPAAMAASVEDVYRLSLRMLWHPADAEDATRNIFRDVFSRAPNPCETGFRAWVLGVAVNYLLSSDLSPFERQKWTFDALSEDLVRGSAQEMPACGTNVDPRALEEEVRIGCTQTVLLCLDRPHRVAYLLSLMDLDPPTAASILDLDSNEYLQRLEHAHGLVRGFMQGNCGLVNPARPCRCNRRLARSLFTGRVDPENLLFVRPRLDPATPGGRFGVGPCPGEEQAVPDVPLAVFRNQPLKSPPRSLLQSVVSLARRGPE